MVGALVKDGIWSADDAYENGWADETSLLPKENVAYEGNKMQPLQVKSFGVFHKKHSKALIYSLKKLVKTKIYFLLLQL